MLKAHEEHIQSFKKSFTIWYATIKDVPNRLDIIKQSADKLVFSKEWNDNDAQLATQIYKFVMGIKHKPE